MRALPANKGWVPHCPDFLWRLVAPIHSMRLSLMKGAHADFSSTAWQEIGVKPYFGLSGTTTALNPPFLPCAKPKGICDFSSRSHADSPREVCYGCLSPLRPEVELVPVFHT
jgi:hypothetical protein